MCMLTQRQIQIFSLLEQKQEDYMTGTMLSEAIDCSIKTLQNEIKDLKNTLEAYDIEILSMTSRGYQLFIHDENLYQEFKQTLIREEEQADFNHQTYRINFILSELLKSEEYMKADQLADAMFVSRSSISGDIKIVRKILEKYHLTMDHKPNYGMRVTGNEKDKRDCIIKEQLALDKGKLSIRKEWIPIISDIVVENLMKSKYRISDVVLQNLVIHICVAIQRMHEGIYVEQTRGIQGYGPEQTIARNILQELSERFQFQMQEEEVLFLALHLLGKRSYEENDLISTQIDTLVNNMLEEIKAKTNIDFYGDVELKISLALHMVPLLVRLENHMQLKNTMVQDIQTSFPLAYDVAVIAAAYIQKIKEVSISNDEIGYLAVHFSLSLAKKEQKRNPKKVLIICNARRGDYLMMQHMFLKEFSDMISDLEIMNALEIREHDMSCYDCIFATFLNHPDIPANAQRINFFLDHKDIQRIQRVLSGESGAKELIKYFHEECFVGNLKANDYAGVMKEMCKLACEQNDFDEDLYMACMRRENLGSTAYGHLIALPHPDRLISRKTLVITAILKDAIMWSEQKVQMVFLICVEKGNHKDLQLLFECISKFMMEETSVQEVIRKGNYQTFIAHLEQLIG